MTEKAQARCLCLDIETHHKDRLHLREIGAFRPDTDEKLRISGKSAHLVAELDKITEGAAFVLGHNLIGFDQPALLSLYPELKLHQLPLVDTLELSPIAFPQSPYHRLVKDYKLCTTTRNNPLRDAELAYELFQDQFEALKLRVAEHSDETLCLHFLLVSENGKGSSSLFATLRGALRPSMLEAQTAWKNATSGKVCLTAQQQVLNEFLSDAVWHKPLAYVLAWLRVAGGNSILPPWVRMTFPKTQELIVLLRDTPCSHPGCLWCQEQHDLLKLLPRYFPGIHQFRATPTTEEGQSLQQAIVENGFAGIPTLAILPTGGGKSLCYQLPALARFYRSGSLTVIISPLQSLMKDQVDNLEARGITCVGYLNSLLNPLERSMTLNKLRLGDLGLIFVAPEQFRSPAFTSSLLQREIAAWVFDEAHCLSKWGHDFRPDYLYVSRFIKNKQKDNPSPVFCFTATAKPDVVEDIVEHFASRLKINLQCLTGGVSRDNLSYEVQAVPIPNKKSQTLNLLKQALQEEGGAIVFCAKQKTVEDIAEFLQQAELACGYFHGGMLPEEKRQVQEGFINGELRVIVATNAFGMGVDKADVRLVIHFDTPGSLENYLQEAGRAGRDQDPARCILLYDDADLDIQFRLLRNSRLNQHDINSILKAVRSIERKDRSEGSVVLTTGEILLEIPDRQNLNPEATDTDTKVRIAIAWLEEARLLERQENHIRVFPGSLKVSSFEEAQTLLEKKLDNNADIKPYLALLSYLMDSDDDEGISTDELMLATGQDSKRVMQILRDLDRFKLVSNDTEIGVTLYREPDTIERLTNLQKLEDSLINCLRIEAPDVVQGEWQILNMRRLCDILRREAGIDLEPDKLSRLLKSFAEAFGNNHGQQGFFALRPAGQDTRYIKLLRNWQNIDHIRHKRMQFAHALVNYFLSQRQGNNLLVVCKQGELEAALQADLSLQDLAIKDWYVALSSALLYLNSNEVLHLAQGKAVFRTAMTVQLNPEARRRQFKKSDYAELDLHYKDKIIQVHVMAEYARLGLGKIQEAMAFVVNYFSMDHTDFIRRYFAGRQSVLDMATTEISHRRILTSLQNPEQQAIVAAPPESNFLVLAGPGSGKTKVIVHRVAWLLREAMAAPEEIMVLTYNRAAAVEIRKRLWALVGHDAAGVCVQTLHSLAMRLTGTSYAVAIERGEAVDFSAVIKNATAQLQKAEQGDEVGAAVQRDRLLSGLRYLLVDEYQDINAEHYELISTLAGRRLNAEEDKLSVLAVGDDDQNIYAFGGADAQFIKQFAEDYQAQKCYLLENYRSTAAIIQCANALINKAQNRLKSEQQLRVNHARRNEAEGGEFAKLDRLTQGRVQIIETPADLFSEAQLALEELLRLNRLKNQGELCYFGQFAVIAREWKMLEPLEALCRQQKIPTRLLRDDTLLALHQPREGYQLLRLLRGQQRTAAKKRLLLRWGSLSRWFKYRFGQSVNTLLEHPYQALLAQFISNAEAVAPGCQQVVSDLIENLYEFGNGSQSGASDNRHAPVQLLTAHRAKGLEFDHVLILDSGGWQQANDEERRLFYVAMTRARKTLTLMTQKNGQHVFIKDINDYAVKNSPPLAQLVTAEVQHHWQAELKHVWLDWPGCFAIHHPIHRTISRLDVGATLQLRSRSDGKPGWELATLQGETVTRMAKVFQPPSGKIIVVQVAAIHVRERKQTTFEGIKTPVWEVVLPEIIYL